MLLSERLIPFRAVQSESPSLYGLSVIDAPEFGRKHAASPPTPEGRLPSLDGPTQQSWPDVLSPLSNTSACRGKVSEVEGILRESIAAAASDPRWSSSGIIELMSHVLELCEKDCRRATELAVGLLDFADAVDSLASRSDIVPQQKATASTGRDQSALFKRPITKLSGGKRKRRPPQRSATPHPLRSSCTGTPLPAQAAAGACGCQSSTDAPKRATSTAGTSCSGDKESLRKRLRCAPAAVRQHAPGEAPGTASSTGPVAVEGNESPVPSSITKDCLTAPAPVTRQWVGAVKQRVNNAVVELLRFTADIPIEFADQFPPTLYVSDMLHLRKVFMGRHHIVKCHLDDTSQRQRRKLKQLATSELVAIVQLQLCTLVLCPFMDSSDPARVVGFLFDSNT